MSRRHLPGLRQTLSEEQDVVDGFYLVRVERIFYKYAQLKPFFSLRLCVLAPAPFAGRTIHGRLYCTTKALWKLSWFLRDFGYDQELLGREEIDERAVVDLTGIVHISHRTQNGRTFVNLAGFASAAQWPEFASLLPPGSDLDEVA
jgi:hypothetical protein